MTDLTSPGPTLPNTHETVRAITGPLELVPPGIVDAREWRPDWEQAVRLPPRDGQAIVGVARVG